MCQPYIEFTTGLYRHIFFIWRDIFPLIVALWFNLYLQLCSDFSFRNNFIQQLVFKIIKQHDFTNE